VEELSLEVETPFRGVCRAGSQGWSDDRFESGCPRVFFDTGMPVVTR